MVIAVRRHQEYFDGIIGINCGIPLLRLGFQRAPRMFRHCFDCKIPVPGIIRDFDACSLNRLGTVRSPETGDKRSPAPYILVQFPVDRDFGIRPDDGNIFLTGHEFFDFCGFRDPETGQEIPVHGNPFFQDAVVSGEFFRLGKKVQESLLRAFHGQAVADAAGTAVGGMSGGAFPEFAPEGMILFHRRRCFSVIKRIGFIHQLFDVEFRIPAHFRKHIIELPVGGRHRKILVRAVVIKAFQPQFSVKFKIPRQRVFHRRIRGGCVRVVIVNAEIRAVFPPRQQFTIVFSVAGTALIVQRMHIAPLVRTVKRLDSPVIANGRIVKRVPEIGIDQNALSARAGIPLQDFRSHFRRKAVGGGIQLVNAVVSAEFPAFGALAPAVRGIMKADAEQSVVFRERHPEVNHHFLHVGIAETALGTSLADTFSSLKREVFGVLRKEFLRHRLFKRDMPASRRLLIAAQSQIQRFA